MRAVIRRNKQLVCDEIAELKAEAQLEIEARDKEIVALKAKIADLEKKA